MKTALHEIGKAARHVRRTLHVEQDTSADDSGRVRLRERLTASVEGTDGTVTEVLRETVEERSKESPWFSTGTRHGGRAHGDKSEGLPVPYRAIRSQTAEEAEATPEHTR